MKLPSHREIPDTAIHNLIESTLLVYAGYEFSELPIVIHDVCHEINDGTYVSLKEETFIPDDLSDEDLEHIVEIIEPIVREQGERMFKQWEGIREDIGKLSWPDTATNNEGR